MEDVGSPARIAILRTVLTAACGVLGGGCAHQAGKAATAGAFTAKPGEPMDLSSQQMPAGTKGAIVTLEHDPNAPAPTGPTILQAAPPYVIS